jgi:hypothetical protein
MMKKDSKIGGFDIYIEELDYKEYQEIGEC